MIITLTLFLLFIDHNNNTNGPMNEQDPQHQFEQEKVKKEEANIIYMNDDLTTLTLLLFIHYRKGYPIGYRRKQ